MTLFQRLALVLAALWLAAVALRFRRSTPVLLGGLLGLGALALGALALGRASARELGFAPAASWPATAAFGVAWLVPMFAWSPVADRIAARFFRAPPALAAFEPIQESRAKLVAGIAVAWLLGGFVEELVFRGVLLQAIEALASSWLPDLAATALGVLGAAGGAAIAHLYQGPRAALIIAQLSALFGVLFVASGYNLWAVVLCHGLYDTVAFVRFASGRSRFSTE